MTIHFNDDTICAIATAQGGAIGTIRISGKNAIEYASTIFRPAKLGATLSTRKPYSLSYGTITDGETIVDEVVVALFRAPKSYTGEDTVEITCHGSQYILQRVIQLLVDAGCRLAQPGEFTRRAYMNGKMDLSQAEAVADLIASSSAASHRVAINQMRGGYSRHLADLRTELLHLTSLMELELDFADHEELEFADRSELCRLTREIITEIDRLVKSFATGNAIKNGIPVAIVGETNAGKSTLLNSLLKEERAIVSDIHGTTRDIIEDTLIISGTAYRLIDTAGIRQSDDAIEKIGIERSFEQIKKADIILWVVDATCAETQYAALAPKMMPLIENSDKQLLILLNKCDINNQNVNTFHNHPALPISAKNNIGITELTSRLSDMNPSVDDDIIVTNARHYQALSLALDAIRRVETGLEASLSGDFISQDLRECLFHLAEITGGEITTDEVLGNIFSHFCIGK